MPTYRHPGSETMFGRSRPTPSHQPGLSERLRLRTLLFTAFSNIRPHYTVKKSHCQPPNYNLSHTVRVGATALARKRPKASPEGKLSSEARLMRATGGSLTGRTSIRPAPHRNCTPALIRPFGPPSPRGKAFCLHTGNKLSQSPLPSRTCYAIIRSVLPFMKEVFHETTLWPQYSSALLGQ